jgi:hypothetical protein
MSALYCPGPKLIPAFFAGYPVPSGWSAPKDYCPRKAFEPGRFFAAILAKSNKLGNFALLLIKRDKRKWLTKIRYTVRSVGATGMK